MSESNIHILPFQLPLTPSLPIVHGSVDYRDFRDQLLHLEDLLLRSQLENQLVDKDLQDWLVQHPRASARAQLHRQLHSRRALRCNLARHLLDEDFREFATHLADSPLLQRFCGLAELDRICAPSKSTLQRYEVWWPESQVRELTQQLLAQGATGPQPLGLPEALDLESAFLDTTCLAANIHYPTDWILLRDATRTLMKAVGLIRAQGLKQRMDDPESFIRRINQLCIQMTHARAQTEAGQRQRKKILRQMDRVVGTVRQHAQRYRQLLDEQWPETEWTRPQAEQVLGRLDQVLALLPQARQQARQRLLEGQLVANADKILSLYEPDVQVIVRKKAGAEVEFGNLLLLAENPQGLILDWELFQDRAPADAVLLPRSVARMERAYGSAVKAVAADRGFDSQSNRDLLEAAAIYNGVCPRSPAQLQQRGRSWKFKRLQRRRAQLEGRIGILKNVFFGGRARSKGFARRALSVSWAVLTHNLWVLARMRQAAERAQRQAA